MAFIHYTLTLTGAAQRLSTVLANTTVGGPDDVSIRQLTLQGHSANAARIFVGDVDVTATDYGFYLPIPTGSPLPVILGPFESGPIRLSNFYVIGTADEELQIGIIPF